MSFVKDRFMIAADSARVTLDCLLTLEGSVLGWEDDTALGYNSIQDHPLIIGMG